MPNNTIDIEKIFIKLSDNKTLTLSRLTGRDIKPLVKELTQHKTCIRKTNIINGFKEQITIKKPEDLEDTEIDESDNYTYDTMPTYIIDDDIMLDLKEPTHTVRLTFNDKKLKNYKGRVYIKATNSANLSELQDFLALLTITFDWDIVNQDEKELFLSKGIPNFTHIKSGPLGIQIRLV